MAEKSQLDGSFSGLWTCELCGKTGTDCTCEHFDRGYARGPDKTLSDAELMAEVWYQEVRGYRAVDRAYPYGNSPEVEREAEISVTLERIAGFEYVRRDDE